MLVRIVKKVAYGCVKYTCRIDYDEIAPTNHTLIMLHLYKKLMDQVVTKIYILFSTVNLIFCYMSSNRFEFCA